MRRTRGAVVFAAVALGVVSAATPAVADTPAQLQSVTIEGDAVVGSTLQANVDATGDPAPTIDYQWARCDPEQPNRCKTIAGATADHYTITSDDLGYRLVVRVTATNSSGTDEGKSAPTDVVVNPPEPAPQPEPTPQPAPQPTPQPAPAPAPTQPAPAPTQPAPAPTQPAPAPTQLVAGVVVTGPRYLRPFPVVRVAGSSVRGGAHIRLLRVTAPRTARVTVGCRGKGCPVRRLALRPGRIRQFERFLPAGVVITIRVTRASYIGKYVRLVIRSRAAPKRRDACLLPGRSRPVRCPG
jgi:hypothetical protein